MRDLSHSSADLGDDKQSECQLRGMNSRRRASAIGHIAVLPPGKEGGDSQVAPLDELFYAIKDSRRLGLRRSQRRKDVFLAARREKAAARIDPDPRGEIQCQGGLSTTLLKDPGNDYARMA
jgi:hypothetical protein